MTEAYRLSKSVIVDWVLSDPDTGAGIDGATVTGVITRPDGTTAAMSVSTPGAVGSGLYRATYDPIAVGLHAWALTATGAADSAEQGDFVVQRNLTGAPPIELDPSTDVGMIRLRIPDRNELYPIFADADLSALLAAEGSTKRAAAAALEIVASDEVMISKVIRTRDGLQTDGAKVSDALLKRAAMLRKQADDAGEDGGVTSYFDIVEPGWTRDELAAAEYSGIRFF
jgi:hypothetical protein